MSLKIALVISVMLQAGAFIVTISLIHKTKFRISWIMISVGFFLMAVRRLLELIEIFNNKQGYVHDQANSWIAVFISPLIFIAAIYIKQIFIIQSRIDEMRKENEKKILSAIINTEEKERQKFASELHDGLGPILSSVKMAISAINKQIISNKNRSIIEKTEESIDHAITTVKEISNNLSPHILRQFGLEKAIKKIIDGIVTNNELKVDCSSNISNKRFDYHAEAIIYRIIGELVINTIKYAEADKIEINLIEFDGLLELQYFDNGIGFNADKSITKGMGLSNIQSRVKSLDGDLKIHSKPDKGVFVKITIPL